VLGLSAGGIADADDLRAFAGATGVTFPLLEDTANTYDEYTRDPTASPYPIDIVLDADGVIVYFSREYDPVGLRAAVESVLP